MSTYCIFSYGSNSIFQLRGRLKNIHLQSYPAYANNYKRFFCNYSEKWEGSVASIFPTKDSITYGIIVYINERELSILDSFEKNYTKNNILCTILLDIDGSQNILKECIAYLSNNIQYSCLPSEQYLTSIYIMLYEHKDTCAVYESCIIISGFINGVLVDISKFDFSPDTSKLNLASIFVILNSNKKSPYIYPKTLHNIIKKLKEVNVNEVKDIVPYLRSSDMWSILNSKLVDIKAVPFSMETRILLNKILI
jgi:hypothetical protein